MPEQELDLFEIAAGFPAELRAGPAEIVSPEALDPDLLCGLLDHRPDRPVAQGLPFSLPDFETDRRSRPSSIPRPLSRR